MTTTNTNKTEQTRDIVSTIDLEDQTLTIRCINGQQIVIRTGDLAPHIIAMATLHGLKQKIVDAAAISRDPETGRSATIEDKFKAMWEVATRIIEQTEWNAVREGGAGPRVGILIQALCRLYPAKTAADLREWLAAKTKEETAAVRANPKIAAEIESIRAEQAEKAGVNTDDLLGELEGE